MVTTVAFESVGRGRNPRPLVVRGATDWDTVTERIWRHVRRWVRSDDAQLRTWVDDYGVGGAVHDGPRHIISYTITQEK